jgi:hypothetical protein
MSTTAAAAFTFRELPFGEWARLVTDGIEPFASHGLPAPDHWRMLVAEQAGVIVACSSLYETVHNDWWIAATARHHPALVGGLWRETSRVLAEAGVTLLHATVRDAQPEVQAMVERLGYIPAGGQLYLLHVPDCILTKE